MSETIKLRNKIENSTEEGKANALREGAGNEFINKVIEENKFEVKSEVLVKSYDEIFKEGNKN